MSWKMHTPANTPATPPNFPDALTMFSRLKASESFNASSPIASMATSPPQVNWAMGPSAPGQTQQGLWTSGQMPSQVPPPGWPQAVTQQASSEQASVTMEAER
ncbi:UBA-like domain-containing protein 1 isoform X3 [Oncorhynchus tshawytscha]|uniref:UBA-like domain-containing protein 1 isoform X3 n=1 Tax=Oncorhynchus tshawytscha TaxID=74940 RepID=UPI000D09F128|nr:UBA-like domain-containing protein 1 isoform X3 [Oncorhynchus tshawytscha]